MYIMTSYMLNYNVRMISYFDYVSQEATYRRQSSLRYKYLSVVEYNKRLKILFCFDL